MKFFFSLIGCIFFLAGIVITLSSFTYNEPNGVMQQAFINSIQIKGILCFIASGIFWKLD